MKRLLCIVALLATLTGCGAGDVGVMPKLTGIDYFNATERGVREAASELGVRVRYDGPHVNDVQMQVQMIETWIAQRFNVIAVAPNDPEAIAPVLENARERGIKVVTWDADARESARDYFVNQASFEGIARTLIDLMAEERGPDAKYVIVTGSLTADNQNVWMAEMEKYRQEAYPNMRNLSETPKVSEEDLALATQVTTDVLKTYPDLDGIFAITSVALPGAAEALRKATPAEQERVFLTGLATPNTMREYVEEGIVTKFVLWNPVDLGYLTTHVAAALSRGELEPGATSVEAGRLGTVGINGTEILLGDPIVFTPENIGDYDF